MTIHDTHASPTPLLLGVAALLSTGCDRDEVDFRDCSNVDVSAVEALPEVLSSTGLYSDAEVGVLADDVIEFTPRYPLWTDGATKRRFLLLPEGGQIDTSDANDWAFPVGTRFFNPSYSPCSSPDRLGMRGARRHQQATHRRCRDAAPPSPRRGCGRLRWWGHPSGTAWGDSAPSARQASAQGRGALVATVTRTRRA